jgi:hypothetical protein
MNGKGETAAVNGSTSMGERVLARGVAARHRFLGTDVGAEAVRLRVLGRLAASTARRGVARVFGRAPGGSRLGRVLDRGARRAASNAWFERAWPGRSDEAGERRDREERVREAAAGKRRVTAPSRGRGGRRLQVGPARE